MTKELANTLTTALVQFIDEQRPEGTMCCSNAECKSIEQMLEGEQFDIVEAFIQKKLSRLTEFEKCMLDFAKARDEYEFDSTKVVELNNKVIELTKSYSKKLLAIAKKELLSYADESNPAIEEMADLERTFECNPEKLPLWLKNKLDRIRLEARAEGYSEGLQRGLERNDERGSYHFPIMPTTTSGWRCDGIHCTNPHHDYINCPAKYSSGGIITTPNTASGISTLTEEG